MAREFQFMQSETVEWMKQRPLLDTRPNTLRLVVKNEEEELNEAIKTGDEKEIRAEIGDVLFARVAAGMKIGKTINRCKQLGIDPVEVFDETKNKNKINYGWIFFSKHSPFDNPNDAIRCLRLFRKKYRTAEKLGEVWLKHDHYVNDEMAFYDKYWVTKRSREFIKKELKKIMRSSNKLNVATAEELIKRGTWNTVPFITE